MNIEKFEQLVSAYGADPKKWPNELRTQAQDFVQNNGKAAKPLLAQAKKLDEALSLVQLRPPSELLKRRILMNLKDQTVTPVNVRRAAPAWRSVAAMVTAAFALGFGGAQFLPVAGGDDVVVLAETDASVTESQDGWQAAANTLGISEIYSWVEGVDTSSANAEFDL